MGTPGYFTEKILAGWTCAYFCRLNDSFDKNVDSASATSMT